MWSYKKKDSGVFRSWILITITDRWEFTDAFVLLWWIRDDVEPEHVCSQHVVTAWIVERRSWRQQSSFHLHLFQHHSIIRDCYGTNCRGLFACDNKQHANVIFSTKAPPFLFSFRMISPKWTFIMLLVVGLCKKKNHNLVELAQGQIHVLEAILVTYQYQFRLLPAWVQATFCAGLFSGRSTKFQYFQWVLFSGLG